MPHRAHGQAQPLAYHLRLPDAAQPQAIALLSLARMLINEALVTLWPQLDTFGQSFEGPAWKQVETVYSWPSAIGNRLGRCLGEQVGRILRAQVDRKHQFDLIAPILHAGMILPGNAKHPKPGKQRWQIRQDLQSLKSATDDGGNYVALLSLVEQACNYCLKQGEFPLTYEDMQPVPVLATAQIPYAGDDGMQQGQAYQMRLNLDQQEAQLWLRAPEDDGTWDRHWRDEARVTVLHLPDCVLDRLRVGEPLAPTLRLVSPPEGMAYAVLDCFINTPKVALAEWTTMRRVLGFDWGVRRLVTATVLEVGTGEEPYRQVSRPFFLDTGSFDGEQARTRRQIDQLRGCIDVQVAKRDALQPTDPRRVFYDRRIGQYTLEMQQGWKKYRQRNRQLAHLAANVLLLLAWVFGCELIAGESLKTLKSTGRGKGVKGRWTKWRTNSQIRGELWRVLRYKCALVGMRLESQPPEHTSHTCPRCGKPAQTYAAPDQLTKVVDSGHWLHCSACGYHADRDYAGSVNVARLGLAMLHHYQATNQYQRFTVTASSVKPVSYTGTGAALPLPPTTHLSSPPLAGTIYFSGWTASISLTSSYPRAALFSVSQAEIRKRLLGLQVG